MNEISGSVGQFCGVPGRNYEATIRLIDDKGREGETVPLVLTLEKSHVRFDGEQVWCTADLFARLAGAAGRVTVTVYPLAELYGAALCAEFVTTPFTP